MNLCLDNMKYLINKIKELRRTIMQEEKKEELKEDSVNVPDLTQPLVKE